MTSQLNNSQRASDLSEAVLTLHESIRKFCKDMDAGCETFILEADNNDEEVNISTIQTGLTILHLSSPNDSIKSDLRTLEDRLSTLEIQLRQHSQWHPPTPSPSDSPVPSSTHPPQLTLPTILSLSDLTTATNLLTHIITSTLLPSPSIPQTPQASFSKYSWTWDPAWKEFYTYLSDTQTYLYLSRWKLNEQGDVWEHVHMAFSDLTPEIAAEKLGAWEDWRWDGVWGEWCLEVIGDEDENGNGGEEAKSWVFGSKWQSREDGEWEYVGRIGAGMLE